MRMEALHIVLKLKDFSRAQRVAHPTRLISSAALCGGRAFHGDRGKAGFLLHRISLREGRHFTARLGVADVEQAVGA